MLVLAPGDLIDGVRHQLSERGVRIRLRETNDDEQKDEPVDTGGGKPGDRIGKEVGNAESEQSSDKEKKAGGSSDSELGEGGDGRRQTEKAEGGENGTRDIGIQDKDKQFDRRANPDNALDRENRSGDPQLKYGFATKRIANAVESKYHCGGFEGPGSDGYIKLEMSIMKALGLNRDDHIEQLEFLKHQQKGPSKIQVRTIASETKLKEVCNIMDKPVAPTARSAVSVVSNRVEDVKEAQVYFTTPTGDRGWKEVARKASQTPNIRAYINPEGDDPKVSFLHLIDHL
ncbi:VP6 [Orungo virus]|uniref:VP6 n=1 Tax=Orungo virus TaxID=40058 RepID=W5QLY5_9REOV|nr:VP6 [Orungo virus]AFX73395.1 VP6 [Orungo virus]